MWENYQQSVNFRLRNDSEVYENCGFPLLLVFLTNVPGIVGYTVRELCTHAITNIMEPIFLF